MMRHGLLAWLTHLTLMLFPQEHLATIYDLTMRAQAAAELEATDPRHSLTRDSL